MKIKYLLFICLFVIHAHSGIAQSLNGVYAGAELYNTPFNGMQINNIIIYFRPDGTFNNALQKQDWRTSVSGNYKIVNNLVQLSFKNGDEDKKYKLSSNGNLESTAGIKHTLHKVQKVTSVPAATYESKSASTSGGMGTGMPAVGAFSSGYLSFDGNGHFSLDRSSVVGVAGDANGGTVGGKFGKDEKSGGTYKLGDGEIILTFNNGAVSRHSFFYSPPNEEDMIVVDGEFYFREEEGTAARGSNAKKSAKTVETGLPGATDLLHKLRAKYGGDNIDKISTVKESSTLSGNLQAVVLTDIINNKVRAELRQSGKLLLVKQLNGNTGWQWMNGIKKPLSQNEKAELRLSLYQGILGLHKQLNNYFLSGTVSRSGDDYLLTFFVDNHKLIYLVGSDYEMKGNAYSITATPNISIYSNFVKAGGITYPATTESRDGQNKVIANTTSIEFNPVLDEQSWKAP